MSESSNMGLFGSKEENTESGNENRAMDKNKERTLERAPYNIDSDCETYDTEALSIMDINDIIGIQGDSSGDSTLESEFAALSKVITGSKEDLNQSSETNTKKLKGKLEEKKFDKSNRNKGKHIRYTLLI